MIDFRKISKLIMNYDYKGSRLLLASVLLVALVHAVPVLLRDEDDGQNVKQQELELYKNYSRQDLLIELLEIKKQFQLNVSNVEKTHMRRRRSSEAFQFPLDVCGTIPEVSYSYFVDDFAFDIVVLVQGKNTWW